MLTLIATLFFLNPSFAQDATSSKSRLDMYLQGSNEAEAPAKGKSFSAKVRVVREVSDDVEVFFEGNGAKGAYTLPRSAQGYAGFLQSLEASRKPNGPHVSVTADSEKRITGVQLEKRAEAPSTGAKVDADGKWDFGGIGN